MIHVIELLRRSRLIRDVAPLEVTHQTCLKGVHVWSGGFELGRERLLLPSCDKPNFLKCRNCSVRIDIPCGATFVEQCRPCSARYQAKCKNILATALIKRGRWLEVTATGNGVKKVPWDIEKCTHSGGQHSGLRGCVAQELATAVENSAMPERFNRFVQDFRRQYPLAEVDYGKVAEIQKRGVIHYHSLFTGLANYPLKKVARSLRYLLKKHGFGSESSVKFSDSLNDVARAVNYCAKYLTKGSQRGVTLQKGVDDWAEQIVRLGGYRRFTQSRSFGPSMKQLKEDFNAKRVLARSMETDSEGELVPCETARSAGAWAQSPLDLLYMSYTFRE